MTYKLIPYGKHKINLPDVIEVVKATLSSNIAQGPRVVRFENAIKQKVSAKYALAVNSATSALHLACRALDLGSEDILWTTPVTFVASANCGLYCGSKIDFVDIDLTTGLISIDALRLKLLHSKNNFSLPKVLVVVHLAGSSCDMHQIHQLSLLYGFHVIEDASHALGGKYKNKYIGSSIYSDITIFSFHPVKMITTGEGGAALTNNIELHEKMLAMRSHGIIKDPSKFQLSDFNPWSYEQQTLGYNYRMCEINAALGISQIRRLDKIVKIRNHMLEYYRHLISKFLLPINLLVIPKDTLSSVHLAVICLNSTHHYLQRQLYQYLYDRNIMTQVHYSPVHLHPYYRSMGFAEGMFPSSEMYARSCLTIPLYVGLSRKDQRFIVDQLRAFFYEH